MQVLIVRDNIFRPLMLFEILLASTAKKMLLSRVYHILLLNGYLIVKAKLNWERDLGEGMSEEKWCRVKCFNQSFSGNVNIQEKQYKIVQIYVSAVGR